MTKLFTFPNWNQTLYITLQVISNNRKWVMMIWSGIIMEKGVILPKNCNSYSL